MAYESRRGLGKTYPARKGVHIEELQEKQRIRELAALITTEEQFQKILDDAQPGMREHVERAIRPWLRFPHVTGPGEPLPDGTPTVRATEYVPADRLHVIDDPETD